MASNASVATATPVGRGLRPRLMYRSLLRQCAGVGDERYSIICRELNFAGVSINDIPDRDALHRLLARVEQETVGKNGGGVRGTATRGIADARGHLLQAARKLAEKTGKRLADIIAEASDGKLSLDGLRDLTDADVSLVSAATSRMV